MMEPADTPSFSPARKWKIGANVFVSAVALVAVAAMLNYLAARHYWRWNAGSSHKLSPLTLRVLASLTNRVKVIVFFDRREPLFSPVSELLNEYQQQCRKLDLQYVDYEFPGRAEMIRAQYKFASGAEDSRVIFDNNGSVKVVLEKELSTFDTAAMMLGKQPKRTGFKGEQAFTSAIFAVTEAQQRKVYWLQGHGEHSPSSTEDGHGYSSFHTLLEKENNLAVGVLPPLTAGDIPEDCQLLVIAGPTASLGDDELDKIEKYLDQGGRLFLLFRPLVDSRPRIGLERLLRKWNLEIGTDAVRDDAQGQTGDKNQIYLTAFGSHPITIPLMGSGLSLVSPRSVSQRPGAAQTPDAPKLVELVFTSPKGKAVDLQNKSAGRTGVIPVIAAVERGGIQGVAADRGVTRMVVTGDSFFLGNRVIDLAANAAFANLAINWLLNRDLLLSGITPRPIQEYHLILTSAQLRTVRIVFLAALPGGVLGIGLLVWFRRRH